jgi:hypothetical protein
MPFTDLLDFSGVLGRDVSTINERCKRDGRDPIVLTVERPLSGEGRPPSLSQEVQGR